MENKSGDGIHSPFGNEQGDVQKVAPAPKQEQLVPNPAQPTGHPEVSPNSVPAGGEMPFVGAPKPLEGGGTKLPCRLK